MIDHTARAFDTDLGQVAGKSKKASRSYIVQGRSPRPKADITSRTSWRCLAFLSNALPFHGWPWARVT
jgi:hypothetical protein